MKRFAIVFALLALMAMPAAAQRHDRMKWFDEATMNAAKQLAANLISWARADVIPEVQNWKNQLDNAMDPADLTKLNELRRKATALKARQTSLHKSVRDAWKSEDYNALKSAREEIKKLHAERKVIVEQLKPIAMANRATLESIGVTARPKIKEWIEQARAIGQRWYEANSSVINPMAAAAIGRLMQHKGDLFALVEPKLRTKAAVARFMLWNGDDVTREFEQMIEGGDIEQIHELNLE